MFVLSGAGGVGKTHGICDIALKRLERKAYGCVVFGHEFNGSPDFWIRLLEIVGLPTSLGRNGLLDALETAACMSGNPLLFCVDAVNETVPRNYWLHRLGSVVAEFEKRPHLKLCISCRTSFWSVCLPNEFFPSMVEYEGFSGMEREACNAFFHYYDLEPPLVPVLQPELSNPLYLKLVCETLKEKGLKQLPAGWTGLAPVIRAFLLEKENRFAEEHHVSSGAAIVTGSLLAVANAIANSGNSSISWSQAQSAITTKKPQASFHACYRMVD